MVFHKDLCTSCGECEACLVDCNQLRQGEEAHQVHSLRGVRGFLPMIRCSDDGKSRRRVREMLRKVLYIDLSKSEVLDS